MLCGLPQVVDLESAYYISTRCSANMYHKYHTKRQNRKVKNQAKGNGMTLWRKCPI